MSDVDSRCEKCERDIEQLRGELDALGSEMIEVVGGMLARVDDVELFDHLVGGGE